jgi:cyclopropane fatty-acyl-phospholipid synthase-like methyltransferase
MSLAQRKWNEVMESHSGIDLMWGPTDVDRFLFDPKRIAFFMSRYKFAAKMLRDCGSILDVGCGSGMGTLTFLSDTSAERVRGVDFERRVIDHANGHMLLALKEARPADAKKLEFLCRDFMGDAPSGIFDGVCSLDVIEHIEPERSHEFIGRISDALTDRGVAVIGTPSLAGSQYASVHSQIGHINLYDHDRFRKELGREFSRVFLFSMNDEIVHTGFDKLAHYLIAVCVK